MLRPKALPSLCPLEAACRAWVPRQPGGTSTVACNSRALSEEGMCRTRRFGNGQKVQRLLDAGPTLEIDGPGLTQGAAARNSLTRK